MGSRGRLLLCALSTLLLLPASTAAAPTAIRLFHDSFDARYRTPFGAAATGGGIPVLTPSAGGVPGVGPKPIRMRRRAPLWRALLKAPANRTILKYTFRVKTTKGVYWY